MSHFFYNFMHSIIFLEILCCYHFCRIFPSVCFTAKSSHKLVVILVVFNKSFFKIYYLSFIFKTVQTVWTFNLDAVEIMNKKTDHKIPSEIASTKGWNNNNVSDNQRVLTGFRPFPVLTNYVKYKNNKLPSHRISCSP